MLIKFICTLKDIFESKYQLLSDGREKLEISHRRNPEVFID